jgi:hypothetical protein
LSHQAAALPLLYRHIRLKCVEDLEALLEQSNRYLFYTKCLYIDGFLDQLEYDSASLIHLLEHPNIVSLQTLVFHPEFIGYFTPATPNALVSCLAESNQNLHTLRLHLRDLSLIEKIQSLQALTTLSLWLSCCDETPGVAPSVGLILPLLEILSIEWGRGGNGTQTRQLAMLLARSSFPMLTDLRLNISWGDFWLEQGGDDLSRHQIGLFLHAHPHIHQVTLVLDDYFAQDVVTSGLIKPRELQFEIVPNADIIPKLPYQTRRICFLDIYLYVRNRSPQRKYREFFIGLGEDDKHRINEVQLYCINRQPFHWLNDVKLEDVTSREISSFREFLIAQSIVLSHRTSGAIRILDADGNEPHQENVLLAMS